MNLLIEFSSSLSLSVAVTGACFWEQSEIQRGKVHHRAGTHDQGQRLGVTGSSVFLSAQWPFRPLWGGLQSDNTYTPPPTPKHTRPHTLPCCHHHASPPDTFGLPCWCSKTPKERNKSRIRSSRWRGRKKPPQGLTPPSALALLRDTDARLEDLLRLSV